MVCSWPATDGTFSGRDFLLLENVVYRCCLLPSKRRRFHFNRCQFLCNRRLIPCLAGYWRARFPIKKSWPPTAVSGRPVLCRGRAVPEAGRLLVIRERRNSIVCVPAAVGFAFRTLRARSKNVGQSGKFRGDACVSVMPDACKPMSVPFPARRRYGQEMVGPGDRVVPQGKGLRWWARGSLPCNRRRSLIDCRRVAMGERRCRRSDGLLAAPLPLLPLGVSCSDCRSGCPVVCSAGPSVQCPAQRRHLRTPVLRK